MLFCIPNGERSWLQRPISIPHYTQRMQHLEAVVLHETEGLTFYTEKQEPEPAQAKGTEATPQDSLLASQHL